MYSILGKGMDDILKIDVFTEFGLISKSWTFLCKVLLPPKLPAKFQRFSRTHAWPTQKLGRLLLSRQLTATAAKWLQIPSLPSQDGCGGEDSWPAQHLLTTEQVVQEGLYEHYQLQWRSSSGDHHSDNFWTSRSGPQEGGLAVQQPGEGPRHSGPISVHF